MLFICVSCSKIIGCGRQQTQLDKYCFDCPIHQECVDSTPIDTAVKRVVMFLHLPNGCLDHERRMIGF